METVPATAEPMPAAMTRAAAVAQGAVRMTIPPSGWADDTPARSGAIPVLRAFRGTPPGRPGVLGSTLLNMPRFSRRGLRLVLVLAGLVAAYAAAGYLLAPRLLRGPLQREAAARLGRDVTLERLRIDP